MEIYHHKKFLKNYRLRILPNPKLDSKFQERLELFVKDSSNPLLKDHQLIGDKSDYRAFSLTGDIRVVYKKSEDQILLHDIGTHNQVY